MGTVPMFGCAAPPRQLQRSYRGSRDEGGQADDHPRVAAAGAVERAGGAAAAELHAEAEQERSRQHADADRSKLAMNRLIESVPCDNAGKNSMAAIASMIIWARKPAPRRSEMKTRHAE